MVISVEVKIETSPINDYYVRYHGIAIDQPLNTDFWNTQPDKVIRTTGDGFTHTQSLTLTAGSHYIVFGNSASAGLTWSASIYINGKKIASGVVDRSTQLRGDFNVEAPPPDGEGKASIVSIDLPTKLQPGEWITGVLKVKNVGAGKDMIRILVIADWIPKTWESVYVLEVGQTLSASLVSGMVEMPEIDAHFTLKGQHEENGVWITDDTRTH